MPSTRCKFRVTHIDQYATTVANPDWPAAHQAKLREVCENPLQPTQDEERTAEQALRKAGIPPAVNGIQPKVFLSPAYAPDDPQSENGRFWQATPAGSIELSINNPAAAEVFEVGREYYVDFLPVD
jgi:hypothetical protein